MYLPAPAPVQAISPSTQPSVLSRSETMNNFAIALSLLLFVGCGESHAAATDSARADSLALVRLDSVNRAQPGYIVDSILPIEEHLRRFRVGLTATRHFDGSAPTRDGLVQSFMRSLESADTAALVRLTISRAEFAYLVYPGSPLSAPPYAQAPDLVWMRHVAASLTGLNRVLGRVPGTRLWLRSWSCSEPPIIEGANRIWRDCMVRFAPQGGVMQTMQLFSSIIEREGQFKILSYANAF